VAVLDGSEFPSLRIATCMHVTAEHRLGLAGAVDSHADVRSPGWLSRVTSLSAIACSESAGRTVDEAAFRAAVDGRRGEAVSFATAMPHSRRGTPDGYDMPRAVPEVRCRAVQMILGKRSQR
jgi:hypothetical protein